MSWIKNHRQGFNHERFAEYVMGKLSFIMTPDTIGDDIGGDLFGFFMKVHPTKPRLIIPTLPFAMQVKGKTFRDRPSKKDRRYIQSHVRELATLKVPFYIGISDQENKCIDVYSGIGLTALFALFNLERLINQIDTKQTNITFTFVDTWEGIPAQVIGSDYRIVFYKVATLTPETGIESKEYIHLIDECAKYVRTIESSTSGEFIFSGASNEDYKQWLGIGTYAHAVRRMAHSAYVLSAYLYTHRPDVFDKIEEAPFSDKTVCDMLYKLKNTVSSLHSVVEVLSKIDEVEPLVTAPPLQDWIDAVASFQTAVDCDGHSASDMVE